MRWESVKANQDPDGRSPETYPYLEGTRRESLVLLLAPVLSLEGPSNATDVDRW
jgi:hypothetical protein